jgi:hypothetical protein
MMSEPIEPDDYKVKRYENLYDFSKSVFDLEYKRFEEAEIKTNRYIPILIALFGIGSIGSGEFLKTLKNTKDIISWVFLSSYVCFYITGILALIAFLRALSVQSLLVPPVGPTLVRHFQDNRYIDVIFSLARSYLEATQTNKARVNKKFSAASFGFWLLATSVFMALISTGCYLMIKSKEVSMSRQEKAPISSKSRVEKPAADAEQVAPRQLSPAEPNPMIQAPNFEESKKAVSPEEEKAKGR